MITAEQAKEIVGLVRSKRIETQMFEVSTELDALIRQAVCEEDEYIYYTFKCHGDTKEKILCMLDDKGFDYKHISQDEYEISWT